MPSSNPAGMLRAKKLADEAKSFSTIKKKAEANVVRWEWATSHRTEPEPGYFETRRQARGKPLETEPTDWKEDRAHEGFDAQNRIVALHVQRNTPNWQYETFYRYEPGGIARFSYDYGDNAWLDCVYLTVENDRVVQADHIYPRGHRTEVYRFDTNGHYAGYDTEGVSASDKKPFKGGYDFDTAPDGTILRVWWLWPDKPREVFWEHASVKAAKKAAKAAAATKPAAKKPAAKKPAATKTPAKKTPAKKPPAKKTPAKKPTKR